MPGFCPESKIFSATTLHYVANTLASLWEDALRRMNRYQLPSFDKKELRTKMKVDDKECQLLQDLYQGNPKKALLQQMRLVDAVNKQGHVPLTDARAKIILGVSLARPPEPTEFELGVNRFIKQMMTRHDEDLTELEAILRKSEAPAPRVKKMRATAKRPAAVAAPVVRDLAQEAAHKKAAEARLREMEERKAAEERHRLEDAEAERAAQEKIAAEMVAVRLAKQQRKQAQVAATAGAQMGGTFGADDELAEHADAPWAAVIPHLKRAERESLESIFSMNPTDFDAVVKTLRTLGLRVEPASGGVKVWAELLTGHAQMLHFHRPHHAGNTLHLRSQKELRRMLWNMGLTKNMLGVRN